jgi:nitrite reductase (NO-forming)
MTQFNLTRRSMLAGAAIAGAIGPLVQASFARANEEVAPITTPTDLSALKRVKVDLVKPPFVHAHTQKADGPPKIVEFTLTIQEKKMVIDDQGTELHAMTFDGSVPGPMMVVHQDDYVELTLINPETNELQHNIDFHSATGALGGGALTIVNPGEKAVLRFKATKAGVFVYHCAPPGMVPWHVTSGMNGAIMVLPREGLTDGHGKELVYDKVYYVGEQDFYVPKRREGSLQEV